MPLHGWPALIGRGRACVVALAGWRAGREHARLAFGSDGVWIEDLGTLHGTQVNGSRVVRHGPLDMGDEIAIAGYRLRVQSRPAAPRASARDAGLRPTANAMPPKREAAESPEASRDASAFAVSREDGRLPPSRSPASRAAAMVAPGAADEPVAAAAPSAMSETPAAPLAAPDLFSWRQAVHALLLDTIDLRRRDLVRMSDAELRIETEALIREIVRGQDAAIPHHVDRERLIVEVLNEAIGLGPLEDLLADASITEIMVNRHDEIFVERDGRLARHPLAFTSDRAVLGVIERIVAPLGRRIDESSPMVDARLKDGSRVNAVIPPLALKGPTLTIRKFAKRKLQPQDLVRRDSVSAAIVAFLRVCVEQRKNVIVSGGTGSGKTTFLNVLSNFIPDGERIVTVEDAAELQLNHSHLISLEARPANAEGRGQVAIRDLVKNCLRMRPDRIVVGECRGGEALDMLQAMNTGHEGSLTTLHANSPRDALARLETMVLMAGMDLPLVAIREQAASAVDVIVQLTRFACGSRKITSVAEVCGMENGRVQLLELFRFERAGYGADGRVRGRFEPCDAVPTFYEELREQGAALDIGLFAREPVPALAGSL
ncbi:MAG TPA: ATPase, T2SS/T4P/T4SS family [Methylibium sp.]|nr:ATPase, T2SS/T4P/T4SS family [Methylibium sp.]HEU4458265.1 ATPase, T2SS/T4P/T4SS family [Methylibium sp.]